VVVNEPPRLHALVSEQESIGWKQLFLGRFSKKWVDLQTTFIHSSSLTPNYCNHGMPWLKQIINFIWSECKKLWSLRNEARHGKDEEAQLARRYEQCRRETEWLYGFKDECIVAHRTDIFHNTLQEHYCIERTERQLRTWIHCHKKAILASVEKRHAQQAQRSRSLRGRSLRLNSCVRATRPTTTTAPTIAPPSGPRQQPITRWFGRTNQPQEPTSDPDDSSHSFTSHSHSSSSDNSTSELSSHSSTSSSSTYSEDSSTDDSSHLTYSSDDDSSQLDYSSDDTSSHLDLPRRTLSVALQRKFLAMTKTHRRTVTSRGRRRRAIRRMSKPTVKMKHTASILPTGP
jgi:hypothetical protein